MNNFPSRLPHSSPELTMTRSALQLLSNLVCQCNESARYMERMEEMLILSQQLDFRCVNVIIILTPRYIVFLSLTTGRKVKFDSLLS